MTGFCPNKKGSLKESECHFDGYCSECPHNTEDDTISRRAALDEIRRFSGYLDEDMINRIHIGLNRLPSAQSERDIPMKPNETTDTALGIPTKQAVCPKCDYYLGRLYFLGDSKNKKVTYCETCGQAIDWEGWEVEWDWEGWKVEWDWEEE